MLKGHMKPVATVRPAQMWDIFITAGSLSDSTAEAKRGVGEWEEGQQKATFTKKQVCQTWSNREVGCRDAAQRQVLDWLPS